LPPPNMPLDVSKSWQVRRCDPVQALPLLSVGKA
jgi:hypothetical protein